MLLVLWASVSWSASLFRDTWDRDFKNTTELFLPFGTPWQLLKAQCYQESRLKPMAVSPVGAYGLCQFMPGTARDVSGKINATPDQFWLPEVSIRASGYYMGELIRAWKSPRTAMDRHKLALCAYNAGLGNCLKAQRLCDNAKPYENIILCLPQVTGKHSKETINYVDYIVNRWYPQMLLG